MAHTIAGKNGNNTQRVAAMSPVMKSTARVVRVSQMDPDGETAGAFF